MKYSVSVSADLKTSGVSSIAIEIFSFRMNIERINILKKRFIHVNLLL